MFLSCCSPMSSKATSSLPRTSSCTRADTQIPPGSATPRDVHAIPEDVAVVGNDVTNIDAHANLDPLLLWHLGITLRHAPLDIDGATHRINYATELSQQPIAGVLDDPATVLSDLGIDKRAQMVLELCVRSLL